MSKVWVTSDWHLGHRNIARLREQVTSVEDNTKQLVENYLKVVSKKDVVWFLGDIIFDITYKDILLALPGDKRIILGNHDNIDAALSVFGNKVFGLVKYKKAWLSHAPIHTDELRNRLNIHGHTHYHIIDDLRYFNVCVDQTFMKPVLYQEIVQ